MSTDTSFGVKASGLIHLLSTTIDQLSTIGYFNDVQTLFIQRFAFKCDDAMKAAAGFGQVAEVSKNRKSQNLLTFFKKLSAAGITTTPVIAAADSSSSKAEVLVHHGITNRNNHMTPDKVNSADPEMNSKSIGHGVENEHVGATNQVEETIREVASDESNVNVPSSSPEATDQTSKTDIFAEIVIPFNTPEDNKDVENVLSEDKVAAPHETVSRTEGEVILDSVPITVEQIVDEALDQVIVQAVDQGFESAAADLPTFADAPLVVELQLNPICAGRNKNNETEVIIVSTARVSESTSIIMNGETKTSDRVSVDKNESGASAVVNVVEKSTSFDDFIVAVSPIRVATEHSSCVETASIESSSASARYPILPSEAREDLGGKAKHRLPYVASSSALETRTILKNAEAAEIAAGGLLSAVAAQSSSSSHRNGPHNHKHQAITVRLLHTGPLLGKKNIRMQSRIIDDKMEHFSVHTTYHCAGAFLQASEYHSGSPAYDGLMPFLELRRADRFYLLEQRSSNIYLARRRARGDPLGLVRISLNEMSRWHAEIGGCLKGEAEDASVTLNFKPSIPEPSNSRSSSANLEEKIKNFVRSMPSTPKMSPQSSPKSPTKLSSKHVSLRSALEKPADNSEQEIRINMHCDENVPHMKGLKAWQTYIQAPYVEDRPERHRYVDIWTPDATD